MVNMDVIKGDIILNYMPLPTLWRGIKISMDDLRFYVLFNSISVISGRCSDDNERLCAMELCYG